jgi:hypothetical protein
MARTSSNSVRHFLLCGFVICAPAYANIVYDGSFTTANNTATYSITTDGVLGVLAASDIVSVFASVTGTLAFSGMTLDLTDMVVADLTATARPHSLSTSKITVMHKPVSEVLPPLIAATRPTLP